jgi:tRNA(Ile)-lysidine synthase
MRMQQISSLVQEYDMFPKDTTILCAVSGGADSMCLLHMLKELRQTDGLTIAAAHYNHLLRQDASDGDEAFVQSVCAQWDIPFYVGRGDVKTEAAKAGQGTEETARAMRYAFLQETAAAVGAGRIATAHTADDNVETILMRFVRGSGLSGLCGIPPRRGDIVRPLLQIARRDVLSYLSERQVPHREDASNHDLSYTRNRLRHEVVPLLRKINPNLSATVAAAARSLRQDHDYLNAVTARNRELIQPAEGNRVISRKALLQLPPAVSTRIVYQTLEEIGIGRKDISVSHISAILSLLRSDDPSGRVTLPRGALVQRVYEELLFAKDSDFSDSFSPMPLAEGETHIPHLPWTVTVTRCKAPETPPSGTLFFLDAAKASQAPLELRPRKTGDAIRLFRREGTKSLKEWMVDAKIPRHLRELIPVFATETEVAAVAGFGPAAHWAAAPGSPALKIEIEGIAL